MPGYTLEGCMSYRGVFPYGIDDINKARLPHQINVVSDLLRAAISVHRVLLDHVGGLLFCPQQYLPDQIHIPFHFESRFLSGCWSHINHRRKAVTWIVVRLAGCRYLFTHGKMV